MNILFLFFLQSMWFLVLLWFVMTCILCLLWISETVKIFENVNIFVCLFCMFVMFSILHEWRNKFIELIKPDQRRSFNYRIIWLICGKIMVEFQISYLLRLSQICLKLLIGSICPLLSPLFQYWSQVYTWTWRVIEIPHYFCW